MNLLLHITQPRYEVIVYEYNNSFDELLKKTNLTRSEHVKLNTFKNKRRKKEWLSTRNMLQKLYGLDTRITFQGKKPKINKKKYFSLSHSNNIIAIINSNTDIVGIDIEKNNPKLLNFSHKFIHKKEKKLFIKQEHPLLTCLIWSSKEALYKAYGLGDLIFNKEMLIKDIDWNKGNAIGKIETFNYKKDFRIFFQEINNHLLVYAIST